MKKANIASIIFFLSFAGYLTCASAVELLLGELHLVDAIKVLAPMIIAIFFLSAVLFYVLNKFIWADGQRVQHGTKLFNKISISIIFFLCVAGAFVTAKREYDRREEARIAREKIESMTEEEKSAIAEKLRLEAEAKEKIESAKQKAKELEDLRFDRTLAFLDALKKNMKDPNSFEMEYVGANENGSVVCVQYRARNSFGGMNREIAVVLNKKVHQNSDVWNRNCLKNLYDMKHVKYAM